MINRKTKLAALLLSASFVMAPIASIAQEANKLPLPVISEAQTISAKSIDILESKMSYLEQGEGNVVLFVHGNPTSSYLWRNVMPHVSDSNRAIAVDLIGMGQSGKPDIDYSFEQHLEYFTAFVDGLDLKDITLVGHDWGAAIAWEYMRLNPDKVTKIAFMEGVLPPTFPQVSFEAMGEEMGGMFRAFKDSKKGHQMVIENNMFVEKLLPMLVSRPLGAEAKKAYGAPYLKKEDRKPVLKWPREVPIAGEPKSSVTLMQNLNAFMGKTEKPALLLYAEPGLLVPPKAVGWYVQKIKNLETGFIGQGLHFIQEDQPNAIGRALSDWLRRH